VFAPAGGGFLLSDQGNSKVRRVLPDGNIITVAGNGTASFSGDGGQATNAELNAPLGLALSPDGSTIFADGNNNRIRLVNPSGVIGTIAGTGTTSPFNDGVPAGNANLAFPADVALQADGGYLLPDNDHHRIRRVSPGGIISTVAGTGTPASTGDGGPAVTATLNDPVSVALTPDGGYVIAELFGHKVRKVDANGNISLVAGTGAAGFNGDDIPGPTASLNQPTGLAVASDGSVLIADKLNHRVRRVAPDGVISTIAGTGNPGFNGDGGLGPATQLNQPFDVAVTSEGDVLIADALNNRIRLLDLGAPPPPPPPPPAPGSLTLDPPTAERRPGDANVVTATVRNRDGGIAVNRVIRWSVEGPNAVDGTATTDAQGVARITWDGVREGTDTLRAFVDTNGDLTSGPGEPTASATVTWSLPVPVQGRVYNLEPVSGIVKIRVVRRRGKGVHGAGSSTLQTLTEAQQVGFDTIVDVRKGRVRMTTASSRRAGDVQKGEFYGGVYTTTQPRSGARPVTELRLSESLICQPNRRGKVAASRARSRRLWGNGRGRFRTRGRHSTATVRGTIWLTKDSCNATTTTVREGSVVVRDLVKRKNVTVRKGRSYTARRKR
jgi:hypothetical protein